MFVLKLSGIQKKLKAKMTLKRVKKSLRNFFFKFYFELLMISYFYILLLLCNMYRSIFEFERN